MQINTRAVGEFHNFLSYIVNEYFEHAIKDLFYMYQRLLKIHSISTHHWHPQITTCAYCLLFAIDLFLIESSNMPCIHAHVSSYNPIFHSFCTVERKKTTNNTYSLLLTAWFCGEKNRLQVVYVLSLRQLLMNYLTIIHQSGGKYPPLSLTLWWIIVLVYTTQAEQLADQRVTLLV